MRRFDKLNNIIKANLLTEERYLDEKNINELDMSSYAKAMDSTENFPWTQFVSGNKDPKSLGMKKQRVNALARERFENEFYKKYPKGTKIMTNAGPAEFYLLKFKTNYTSYDLIFNLGEHHGLPKNMWVTKSNGEPYVLDSKYNGFEIAPESLPLVNDMLSYI